MSEERKKVSPEQLKILIEELEADPSLGSGREGRAKPDHFAKWEQLAKRLNSMEHGAMKNVSKWQQSLRDWRNNTKKKAAKLGGSRNPPDSGQELTPLELRLLAVCNSEAPAVKPVGIDISSIAEVDPLSSENNSDEESPYPNTFTTYTCEARTGDSSSSVEPAGDEPKVKRRRVEVMTQNMIDQQNRLLDRLATLESARQESENRQNKLLEAVTGALERHAAASARMARAADAQAQLMNQLLEALQERKRDGDAAT